jgi:hypothetical protein
VARPSSEAEDRILDAVTEVATLTRADPRQSARERLCAMIGYRLYRSLVAALVTG